MCAYRRRCSWFVYIVYEITGKVDANQVDLKCILLIWWWNLSAVYNIHGCYGALANAWLIAKQMGRQHSMLDARHHLIINMFQSILIDFEEMNPFARRNNFYCNI